MHMQHITFRVKDIEQSIAFYEKMAGLKLVRRFKVETTELAFLADSPGGTELELVCTPGGATFSGSGFFLCFACDQLDKMHQLAQAEGFNPSPLRDPGDGTRYFYVYDPDKVSVQLRSFPAKEV